MTTPRCCRCGPGGTGTWAGPRTRSRAGSTPCCASWSPAACPRRSPQLTPPASSAQPRRPAPPGRPARELAAELLADMRRLDAQIRESKKKLATAVKASGTSLTEHLRRRPRHRRHRHRRRRRRGPVRHQGHFAAYNGTAPIEVSSGQPQNLPAVAARQPAPQPRHPHGRDHPDPPRPQRRPRLLRPEDRRGQDPQRGAARASNAGSATPSTPACRPTPNPPRALRRQAREGNRGTTLTPARPAHTPHASSSDKPLPGPPPRYTTPPGTPPRPAAKEIRQTP